MNIYALLSAVSKQRARLKALSNVIVTFSPPPHILLEVSPDINESLIIVFIYICVHGFKVTILPKYF